MTSFRRLFWVLALASLWSPSFLFIKLAGQELAPMTITAYRVSIAMILLSCLLLINRRALPTNFKFWMHTTVMAVFSSTLPFTLFCFAEQSIESALAAILNGSSPMFTAILSQLFVANDRMSLQKGLGVGCSIFGLIVLFSPNLQDSIMGSPIGMTAATIAALCYAISHVYAKKFLTQQQPFVSPTAQLIMSCIILWPLALIFENPLPATMPALSVIGGVLGLAVMGTFFAFMIYYKLLEESGPTAISTVACCFPVGGMFLGFLFLGESFTSVGIIAAAMIFTGLLLVNEMLPFDTLVRVKA